MKQINQVPLWSNCHLQKRIAPGEKHPIRARRILALSNKLRYMLLCQDVVTVAANMQKTFFEKLPAAA